MLWCLLDRRDDATLASASEFPRPTECLRALDGIFFAVRINPSLLYKLLTFLCSPNYERKTHPTTEIRLITSNSNQVNPPQNDVRNAVHRPGTEGPGRRKRSSTVLRTFAANATPSRRLPHRSSTRPVQRSTVPNRSHLSRRKLEATLPAGG